MRISKNGNYNKSAQEEMDGITGEEAEEKEEEEESRVLRFFRRNNKWKYETAYWCRSC